MKSLVLRYGILGAFLLLGVCSYGAFAQEANPAEPSEDQDAIASCLGAITASAEKTGDNSPLTLVLNRIDRIYPIDSAMIITVKTAQPGYLYLLDETSTGQIILLAPNRFLSGDEPIEVNKILTYPSPQMKFDFKVTAPCGHEKVYAIVTKEPVEPFQNAIGDLVAFLEPSVARAGLADIVNRLETESAQAAVKDFVIVEKKTPTVTTTDEPQEPLTVVLEHSGSHYIDGEYLRARVTAQREGYLYVLVETKDENGAVLLPNETCEVYHIQANQSIVIPSKNDPFRWRIARKNYGSKKLSFWLMSKPIDFDSELDDSQYIAKVEMTIVTSPAMKK